MACSRSSSGNSAISSPRSAPSRPRPPRRRERPSLRMPRATRPDYAAAPMRPATKSTASATVSISAASSSDTLIPYVSSSSMTSS